MENKNFFSKFRLMMLLVLFATTAVFSSCDDKNKDDDSSNSELVGTWYCQEDGYTDYDDSFTFKSDGTFKYRYEDDYDYEYVSGNYAYDSRHEILTLEYKEDGEWESWDLDIYFYSKNKIEIEEFGTYVRK